MNRAELLKGLSDEQLEKARGCHSSQELLELAKEEGIELTDEQLKAISGGGCIQKSKLVCPLCGTSDIVAEYDMFANRSNGIYKCYCNNCQLPFEVE